MGVTAGRRSDDDGDDGPSSKTGGSKGGGSGALGGATSSVGPAFERSGRQGGPFGFDFGALGGPKGGAEPDPAVAAAVDRALGAVAEAAGAGLGFALEVTRAVARGAGLAAAVARGEPSAVVEVVQAAATAARALGGAAPQADDTRADAVVHDERGLPTAAEWGRRVSNWGGRALKHGLAAVGQARDAVLAIPEARAPLARALARGRRRRDGP